MKYILEHSAFFTGEWDLIVVLSAAVLLITAVYCWVKLRRLKKQAEEAPEEEAPSGAPGGN